jgi:predicted  nucleic acid-binding Zn-ribbon protein
MPDQLPTQPDTPPTPDDTPQLVPVAESIRYRRRAQAAEQQLVDLQQAMTDMEQQLQDANQTITSLERRQRIDAMLLEADAIDIEAARLLTEAAVAEMPDRDVSEAIEDLRQHKPYLFAQHTPAALTMPAQPHEETATPLNRAASQAKSTGHRQDLLAYLRLRRAPQVV